MTEPHRVPAAAHTLRILQFLSSARGPMPAAMIASHLNLPRSTVYHLLDTLQQHDFVLHLAEEKRYGLGVAALELSSAYARQDPLTRVGAPLLATLVDTVHHSAHLALPHGRDVLYAIEERAPRAPTLVTGVNVRLPMHLTASGRAMLSIMPKEHVRALYPTPEAFEQRHQGVAEIQSYAQLRRELDRTVAQGFASERGDVTPGFSSVAVPVRDHREWPVAAIAVTFRDTDFSESEYAPLAQTVAATAAALGARIYGRR